MKIYFLGDSITEGAGASSIKKTFVYILSKKLGCEYVNYGVSGTRIARQKDIWNNNVIFNYDFNMRAEIMPNDADLVICFGGTNDFGHGTASFGNDDSRDVYSFKGAVNLLFEKLIEKYGKKKVVIILPLPRYDEESDKGEFFIAKPAGSEKLSTYVEHMRTTATKLGLKILDFRKEFGVPKTNKNEGLFFDGLHPNDKGHKFLANLIANELRNYTK